MTDSRVFRIVVMGFVDLEITGWVNVTDHEPTFFSTSIKEMTTYCDYDSCKSSFVSMKVMD